MDTLIATGGGFLGGVLVALIVSHYIAPRERSADMLADALGDLIAATHRNVNGQSMLANASDEAQDLNSLESGAAILRAELILATAGSPDVQAAVQTWKRAEKRMGERPSQDAFVALIQAVRDDIAPHRDRLSDAQLREMLFE